MLTEVIPWHAQSYIINILDGIPPIDIVTNNTATELLGKLATKNNTVFTNCVE